MKDTKSYQIFRVFNVLGLLILSFVFVLPFWIVVTGSFTDNLTLITNGYSLGISKFSLDGFKFVFSDRLPIIRGLWNSVKITVLSVVFTTFISLLYAYPLSKPNLKGRKFFNVYLIITMLFSGGLIPGYLTITTLFPDSIWSLIIPGGIAAWYVFLIRNYFNTIPSSLGEAATIDGAGEFIVFLKIYLPLSKPVIAVVALYVAVNAWNGYVAPMFYLESVEKFPVALMVKKLLDNVGNLVTNSDVSKVPTETVKMSSVVVSTLPIIIVYPFLQKYFINGMMIGGVKE